MTEEIALFLTSDDGRVLLAEVAAWPEDIAARVLALRKRGLPPEQVSGVVSVAAARVRARRRFVDADRLFFTDDALAQATSPGIAMYHAERLASFGIVADLGCGVGMDAIALAEAGARVVALEQDPARLMFARANAAERGVSEQITFQLGDVTALEWEADAAYWDPSRRDGSQRVSRHADRYEPPLTFLEAVRERVRGGAIKLSPALPDEVLEELGGRIEFLSEGRECKEACVWFGEARGVAEDLPWAAVLLPERAVVPSSEDPAPVRPLGAFLFDPDPALVRANALGTVAAREAVGLISPDDAYLTGNEPLTEPRLATVYRVVYDAPYKPKALGVWLRERGVGRLVVKKRHFAKEPDAVHRELGLKGGGDEMTLVLVREGAGHRAVCCQPGL